MSYVRWSCLESQTLLPFLSCNKEIIAWNKKNFSRIHFIKRRVRVSNSLTRIGHISLIAHLSFKTNKRRSRIKFVLLPILWLQFVSKLKTDFPNKTASNYLVLALCLFLNTTVISFDKLWVIIIRKVKACKTVGSTLYRWSTELPA